MAIYTSVLALLGLLALASFAEGALQSHTRDTLDAAKGLFGMFILGAVASTWVANFLIMQRPRR